MNRSLNAKEEDSIVEYINHKLDTGMTVTKADVIALGSKTLQMKHPNRSVGASWFKGFMKRHPEFYNRWKNSHAASRRQGGDYRRVKAWFELFHKVVVEGGISDDNVYNMDELNIQFGESTQPWTNQRHRDTNVNVSSSKSESESTESAIILETVSMGGTFLQPYVIIKGLNTQDELVEKRNLPKFYYQCSSKDSTSDAIAIDWLEKIFIPQTKAGENGKEVTLILNGNGSRTNDEFLQKCFANNIRLLFMPPDTSHFLQPIHLSCFEDLKNSYWDIIDKEISDEDYNEIDNTDFIIYYDRARKKSFSRRTICQSWKVVGLKHQNYQEVIDGPNIINHPTNKNPKAKVVSDDDQNYLYEFADREDLQKALKEFMLKSDKNLDLGIELLFALIKLAKEECGSHEQPHNEFDISLQIDELLRIGKGTEFSSDEDTVLMNHATLNVSKMNLVNISNKNFTKEQSKK